MASSPDRNARLQVTAAHRNPAPEAETRKELGDADERGRLNRQFRQFTGFRKAAPPTQNDPLADHHCHDEMILAGRRAMAIPRCRC